ncbi:class I SAM-dependent methyltransferase, partial [Nostoc sp. CHAB 5834]|nr:class I SAM-dependent methyltransferase [Nostoc sp. CHAB 5834]
MNAITFHNDIATQFDHKYESSAAFGERFRVWTDLFDRYIPPSHKVLDLGCGSGVFSDFLAKKGCIVTGVDGSEKMIAICRQKNTSATVSYIVQPLPFSKSDAYPEQDAIIASSVLEYMD